VSVAFLIVHLLGKNSKTNVALPFSATIDKISSSHEFGPFKACERSNFKLLIYVLIASNFSSSPLVELIETSSYVGNQVSCFL
jgi:hypothetical protein